jgi:hypothetical protein
LGCQETSSSLHGPKNLVVISVDGNQGSSHLAPHFYRARQQGSYGRRGSLKPVQGANSVALTPLFLPIKFGCPYLTQLPQYEAAWICFLFAPHVILWDNCPGAPCSLREPGSITSQAVVSKESSSFCWPLCFILSLQSSSPVAGSAEFFPSVMWGQVLLESYGPGTWDAWGRFAAKGSNLVESSS